MALELVGGAALGTIFAALYDGVKVALGRTVMQFKPLLGDLKFTLDSLKPRIVQQIEEHNLALGLPNEEINSLRQQMQEGVELVVRLSELNMWNCSIWCNCCNCTKPSYTDQLVELDRSLRILLEILKLQEVRDVKEALLLAKKIHDKQDELDKKLSDLLKVQQEAGLRAHEEWNGQESSRSNNSQTTGQKRIEGNGVQRTALGAVFRMLFGAVIQVKDKTKMFKRILGYLKSTLDSLKPLIEEITEYNKVLHLPKEELENFTIQMETGVELIHKCSKVHKWANNKKYEYTNKLLKLDESLQALLSILRVQLARNVKESSDFVRNTEAVIKQIDGSDMVQNDQVESKGCCAVPEPTLVTVGFDVLNVQRTHDLITETLVSTKNMEEGVKLVEGSSVVQLPNAQIEIKGSCEMVEPPSPAIALEVLNVREKMNVKEMLESAKSMDAGVKLVEGSGVVQNQINIVVAKPSSPTIGLDVMNMQGTRDERETLVSIGEVVDKQTEETKVVELEATAAQSELPSFAVGLDVMNMQGTRDEKETLVSVGEVADKQTEGTKVVELEAAATQSELPSFAVGLDVPLMELKRKFLTDQVPALVITGPEGCGKTTLAKQFCQDEEVKDKFKSNIFFVPVSKEPNLDLIVQKMYQHKGSQTPLLQGEETAVDWLQHFLNETGQHPSLLVLDDVWSGSESLLEKLDELKNTNHKILVTSRSEFPRFGSPYYLKPLNDESRVATSEKYGLAAKMRVVLKMESAVDGKTKQKVMKIVSRLNGLDSISFDKQQLAVEGEMDVNEMLLLVRKIVAADIVSVGPARQGSWPSQERQGPAKKDKAVGPALQEKKESDASDPSAVPHLQWLMELGHDDSFAVPYRTWRN